MSQIVVIAHNIRSTHNVGSLLRTADGLGITTVYLTGYTPYPLTTTDSRLPHMAQKIDRQITKTALGAEKTTDWSHIDDVRQVISELKQEGYTICALEQSTQSIPLPQFVPPDKTAIILGREVEGIETEVLELCDTTIEIPMFGKKESFNVVQAAAMMLYHTKFYPFAKK